MGPLRHRTIENKAARNLSPATIVSQGGSEPSQPTVD